MKLLKKAGNWTIAFVLLMCSFSTAHAQLTHVKGVHAVGLRAGTGIGKTFDAGITYNYYWGKHWSVSALVDVETGRYEKSSFTGLTLAPGVEAAVWHPTTWLYLHLNGHFNVGYDWWNNKDSGQSVSGAQVGCDLGMNFEFYALPSLSFTISAQENFNYGFYDTGDYYYFRPLFMVGVRYNIL